MKASRTLLTVAVLFWLAAGSAPAQVESGPQVGSEAKAIKAVALIKDEEEKEKDLVAERGPGRRFSCLSRRISSIGRWLVSCARWIRT